MILELGGREALDKLLKDENASRLSIQYFEGSAIGEDPGKIYVKLEGPQELLEAAKKLLSGARILEGEELERIEAKFKEAEEKATEGFGAIFG